MNGPVTDTTGYFNGPQTPESSFGTVWVGEGLSGEKGWRHI